MSTANTILGLFWDHNDVYIGRGLINSGTHEKDIMIMTKIKIAGRKYMLTPGRDESNKDWAAYTFKGLGPSNERIYKEDIEQTWQLKTAKN